MAILVHEFPDTGIISTDYNSIGGGAIKTSSDNNSSNTGSTSGSDPRGQGAVIPSAPKRSGKVTITLNGSATIQVKQGSTTTGGVFGGEEGRGGA